jgi:hypothetical protein
MADEKKEPIAFTDEETKARFEATTDSDQKVTIPNKYTGPLSGIPVDVAEGMVKRKSNLLKEKGAKSTTGAGSTAGGAGKEK